MEQWNSGMMGKKDKPIIPLFQHSKSEMDDINRIGQILRTTIHTEGVCSALHTLV